MGRTAPLTTGGAGRDLWAPRYPQGVRSLSFLLSRRWIIFFLTIIMLVWGAWWLGEWQFHRLDDRKDRNDVIERNIDAPPVDVSEVFDTERGLASTDQWRRVTASGEYDVENTVVVRYRTRDRQAGVDVVVPFITEDGTALIVDRGWMATDNRGTRPDELPDPPAGTVTITGVARQDATGDAAKVTDHSTRAISSVEIAEATGLTAYQGFVDLTAEDPAPETPLQHVQPPDQSNGPHFFYGLQWWFFGLLAVVGFIWMAVDEYRGKTGKRPQRNRRSRRERRQRLTAAERLAARQEAMGVQQPEDSQGAKGATVDGDDRTTDVGRRG